MIWRCDLVPQYEAYKEEIDTAIEKVLKTGRYILASEVKAFEDEFASYIGTGFGVGVANGTDALVLAMMVLNIGPGDEVITTPYTAVPTVSAIIDTGAKPVFVDICPDTFLIDLAKVKAAITDKTKAVIPVHIFGNVVDIPALREIVGTDIAIIEDACQAHGSALNGVKCGAMGDMSAFSFYPTKNLGGYGDGGIILTNKGEYAEKLKLLRMYGMVDYNHIVINGINSRLDEIQAAILRVKLKYLDDMNRKRNIIAERYRNELRVDLFEHQAIPDNVYSNYHVYVTKFKKDRNDFIRYLEQFEIQTNIYYLMPIHLQKANENLGIKQGVLPISEKVCSEVIALPLYPELKADTLDFIIDTINNYQG